MATQISLKFTKSGGVATGFQEFEPTDQLPAGIVSGLMGKNQIINGNFRWWQRNNSFLAVATAAYTADRWIPVMVNDTIDVIRTEHPAGDATNINNSKYFMRCSVVQVAGNDSLATLQYRLENGTNMYAGKTVTVSFRARASSGTRLGVELEQTFGTGGSPSPSVYIQAPLITTVTGGWQTFSCTFTLPSTFGKTFGTSTDPYLGLIFWMDAGSDWATRSSGVGRQAGDFQFGDVQFELGDTASPFEVRPDGLELILCQRYYEKSYELETPPGTVSATVGRLQGTAVASTAYWRATHSYNVEKRTPPAVTFYSPTTGATGAVRNADTGADVTGVLLAVPASRHVVMAVPTQPTGHEINWHFAADAEL